MPEPGQPLPDESRAEIRLIARAIGHRWPIAGPLRAKLLDRLGELVYGEHTKQRTLLAAARALLMADRVNLQGEALDLRRGDGGDVTVAVTKAEARDDAYDQPAGPGAADQVGPAPRAAGPVP